MTTFTEIVAAVVVQSSALALSHFGVVMAPAQVDAGAPPAAERVVARSHAPQHRVMKLTSCPDHRPAAHAIKV
jgi:hypothetical protein